MREYTCTICRRRFSNKYKLIEHMRIHASDKPYACTTCERHFRIASDLHTHEQTHTEVRTHTCKNCGRSFSQKGRFYEHMRIHASYKPYTCTTCGKHFRIASDLHTHKQIHTEVRTYTCKNCGRSFSRKLHLHKHMKLHRAEATAVTTESREEAAGTVTTTTHTFSTAQVFTKVTYVSSHNGCARIVTQKDPSTTTTSVTQGGETSSYTRGWALEEQEAAEALLELRRAEGTDE